MSGIVLNPPIDIGSFDGHIALHLGVAAILGLLLTILSWLEKHWLARLQDREKGAGDGHI